MSSSSESDPILVSYHDSIVRRSNLQTLDPKNWLDDNIINFILEYLQYDSKYSCKQNEFLTFVTPPIVQLLKMSDDIFAEELLQTLNITEKKFLLLPINDNKQVNIFGGSHWSLIILSIQEQILYHFDSSSLANNRTAKEIQGKFQYFFHQTIPLINSRCPQQKNGYDCGLYVIVLMEEFCRCIHQYDFDKINENIFFSKFIDEIQRTITEDIIDHRRIQLKLLLQSMSI